MVETKLLHDQEQMTAMNKEPAGETRISGASIYCALRRLMAMAICACPLVAPAMSHAAELKDETLLRMPQMSG